MLDVDPKRFELEERIAPSGRSPHQQLERGVGSFEVIAGVFELLELVEHRFELGSVEFETQLLGLQFDRGTTGEIGHQEAGAVADERRIDVFVGVGAASDGRGVQTGLVCEGGLADVGQRIIRWQIDQLGNVSAHRR